jgi:hypothetical protein
VFKRDALDIEHLAGVTLIRRTQANDAIEIAMAEQSLDEDLELIAVDFGECDTVGLWFFLRDFFFFFGLL